MDGNQVPAGNSALAILTGAFPSLTMSVIQDVLDASDGNVRTAFDALLEMAPPNSNLSTSKPYHEPKLQLPPQQNNLQPHAYPPPTYSASPSPVPSSSPGHGNTTKIYSTSYSQPPAIELPAEPVLSSRRSSSITGYPSQQPSERGSGTVSSQNVAPYPSDLLQPSTSTQSYIAPISPQPTPPPPDMSNEALVEHLEKRRFIPKPNEWLTVLQPKTGVKLHMGLVEGANSWRDCASQMVFYNIPDRDWPKNNPPQSSYSVDIKHKKGHVSWILTHDPTKTKLWCLSSERDGKTAYIKSASLSRYTGGGDGGGTLSMSWQHGPKADILSFTAPTGIKYCWISSMPYSNVNGSRMDLLVYALFTQDYQGRDIIVADYAPIDGHPDNPSDQLTIRDQNIEVPLVLASLLTMLTYQLDLQDRENAEHAEEVAKTEAVARAQPIGRMTFWYKSDAEAHTKGGLSSFSKHGFNNGLMIVNQSLSIATNVINAAAGGSVGG